MNLKTKVYVAGPLTSSGRFTDNVRNAIHAGDRLIELGFCPFVPHAFAAIWDIVSEKTEDQWLDYDEQWVAACDAILVLPGESTGTRREVVLAGDLGIPVFHSMEDLIAHRAFKT